jgi:hypothetical protein
MVLVITRRYQKNSGGSDTEDDEGDEEDEVRFCQCAIGFFARIAEFFYIGTSQQRWHL